MGRRLRKAIAVAALLTVLAGGSLSFAADGPSGSGFMEGLKKFFKPLAPTPSPAETPKDGISLDVPAKPSAELYLAMARMYEQTGKLDLAEKQYKLGLKLTPKHLALQLGYARLQDRLGRLDQAIGLYTQVAKQYPLEAAVHNDLGLCYARRNMLNEAVANLEHAIRLQPQKRLYRNNIAAVLVEMGRVDAALEHLRAAHSEAVAYYNVGYLLEKKGQSAAAATYFAKALEKDPSLTAAQLWLEKLQRPRSPSPQLVRPADPAATGPPVNVPIPPADEMATAPVAPLPPVVDTPPTHEPAGPGRPAFGQDSAGPTPLPPIEPPQTEPDSMAPPIPAQRPALPALPQWNGRPAAPPTEDAPLPPPTLDAPRSGGPAGNDPSMAPPQDRRSGPVDVEARRPSRFHSVPAVKPLPPVEDAPLPPLGFHLGGVAGEAALLV